MASRRGERAGTGFRIFSSIPEYIFCDSTTKNLTIRYWLEVGPLSFECSQCGECCSYLGQVHTIIEESGDYHFLVKNQYTGEKTAVSVDPDKISLYCDTSIFFRTARSVPFFPV